MTKIEEKIQITCLLILSIIAIAFALYWLKPIIVPFVLALFLHLAVTPVIDWQKRYFKLPHNLAILSTVILMIGLLILLGTFVSGSVGEVINNANAYQDHIKSWIERTSSAIPMDKIGPKIKNILDPTVKNLGEQVGSMLKTTFNAITTILSKSLLVFIFLLFLFIGSAHQRPSTNAVWKKGKAKVKRYISSKLFISLIQGLLVGIILSILRIDLAFMFGLLAFILNFIPSIGPIIASLLPIPVVLMTPGLSPTIKLLAVIIPGVLMFIIGNLLEPKIVGESLDLHPITVLIALIFWGMLWGIVGMFLAVPLTAVLVLILEEIEITRPVAELCKSQKPEKGTED